MSGGVDSSVSAYLLLKNGYSVDGVTFNLTGDLANQAIKDAKNVALKLGIITVFWICKKNLIKML